MAVTVGVPGRIEGGAGVVVGLPRSYPRSAARSTNAPGPTSPLATAWYENDGKRKPAVMNV